MIVDPVQCFVSRDFECYWLRQPHMGRLHKVKEVVLVPLSGLSLLQAPADARSAPSAISPVYCQILISKMSGGKPFYSPARCSCDLLVWNARFSGRATIAYHRG